MNYNNEIPRTMIKRLPRYYRCLCSLYSSGIKRVSSRELSIKMGITSSQVRNDFLYFDGEGQPGIGYEVDILKNKISDFLKSNNTYKMVVIGAGHLGRTLVTNRSLEKKGFKVIGMFDANTQYIGKEVRGIEIMELNHLPIFMKHQHVDIAAITIFDSYTNELVKKMTHIGLKGIWNLSPVEVTGTDNVIIENSYLGDSLMLLGYHLKNNQ